MEIPVITLYRIQGGTFPNRSRKIINCNSDGTISVSLYRTLYVGDKEHMTYFLRKRLKISSIEDIENKFYNDDSSNVHVIEMMFPYWISSILERYAKPKNSPKNKYDQIYLVDKTTPGKSFGLSGTWVKLLTKSCLSANDYSIKTSADLLNIAFFSGNNMNRTLIDYNIIKQILAECGVTENDISEIMEIYNCKGINYKK